MRRMLPGADTGRRRGRRVATMVALGALLLAAAPLAAGNDGAAPTVQLAAPQPGPPAAEAVVGDGTRWWAQAWPAASTPAGDRPPSPEPLPRHTDGQTTLAAGRPAMADRPTSAALSVSASLSQPVDPTGRAQLTTEALDPGPGDGTGVARRTDEGFDVAAGSAVAGTGSTVRYTVEVEPSVGADLLAVTAAVEQALTDPRSWVVDHRLSRVDDPEQAEVRVLLATPDTVDELCGQAGLRTDGRYSCWNGTFAALNAMRWFSGADGFDDLTTYRRYLVNHEFGHGLGYGHLDCPFPGATAPVMLQQTISTGACTPNGWPYPEAGGS